MKRIMINDVAPLAALAPTNENAKQDTGRIAETRGKEALGISESIC